MWLMKYILNTIKGFLLGLWLLVAIFTTVCLLSYNEYNITEFGKYSLLVVDSDILNNSFEKNSLLIVKRNGEFEYKVGDTILFYNGNPAMVNFVNIGVISNVQSDESAQTSYYIDDFKISYDDIMGNANGAIVYKNVGAVLSILESRWGFMFLIILPTIFLAVFEVYNITLEVKNANKVDLKAQLRKEIEEEMRKEALKGASNND